MNRMSASGSKVRTYQDKKNPLNMLYNRRKMEFKLNMSIYTVLHYHHCIQCFSWDLSPTANSLHSWVMPHLFKGLLICSAYYQSLLPTGGPAVICPVASVDHHPSTHPLTSRPFSTVIKVQDLQHQHHERQRSPHPIKRDPL